MGDEGAPANDFPDRPLAALCGCGPYPHVANVKKSDVKARVLVHARKFCCYLAE